MAIEVKMPQLSDTMHDGKILSWQKSEGEKVEPGDVLAEVETDKADLEIECFDEGTLLKIIAPEGEKVAVGAVIAIVGEAGEEVSVPVANKPEPQPVQSKSESAVSESKEKEPAKVVEVKPEDSGSRVKISPLARNFADSNGVDINSVVGSGEGGRIVKKDVEAALDAATTVPVAMKPPARTIPQPGVQEVVELGKMRSAIARTMVESKTTIPHFYMTTAVVVDALLELRKELKEMESYTGITFNHLIIKATAVALHKFPQINSALKDGSWIKNSDVNIGIVTALPDGLLIPVLKGVQHMSLSDIVLESHSLIQRARAGKPKPDDLSGGTFSISNVGRFDVEEFSAIISPGQGGILAVSAIQQEPVIDGDRIVPGNKMRLTLSVDHRIIDGVMAAEFVTELNRLLSKPYLLLA